MTGNVRVRMVTAEREVDITQYVQSITWGGSYNQFVRTLSMPVLCAAWGAGQQPPDCPMGADIYFDADGKNRFYGKIQGRDLDTSQVTRTLNCVDLGWYLGNKVSRRYKHITPEAMTRSLCREFGFEEGAIAATGVPFSRNFVGESIYKLIQTGYTLAPRAEGARYVTRFRGKALEVVEKVQGPETRVIRPGSNLVSATVRESVSNLVTRVEIRDANGNVVDTIGDDGLQAVYGVLQRSVQQSKDRDARAEAKALMDDSGEEQKITVKSLGGPDTISGDCVVLQEPVSGLYGLFWVDADTHCWSKDGTYSNQFTLNFRNLMDEAEAGSLPDA